MSDIKELNVEELEKVSGGIEYSISRVDAGDVFISRNFNDQGYVVTVTTNIERDATSIPCKFIQITNGQWQTYESTTKSFRSLISNYQYSAELTGTINY